ARLDHEEPDPVLAFLGHGLAGRIAALLEERGDLLRLLVFEAGEEVDLLQDFGIERHRRQILTRLRLRVLDALCKLLDLALGRVELLTAESVEVLAPLPELDRVVERNVAALEPLDDLSELLLCFLKVHSRTSDTVAEKLPSATRTSSSSPGVTAAAARTTPPSWRTIA